jgi:glycolate oxidase FAD binding subunit
MMEPASLAELAEAVRSGPRALAVGAQSKPRLSVVEAAKISTLKLSGIVEYEPDEFTFTALAGTPVRDIAAALAERGQYLPFDPMLLEAGATLGGTVASGLSGPGRFRFGGVRDFILEVRFVDGAGRLLRMGGKVVKNAAGFDLPKFFVGSLGRFGVLGEMTFKVFPCPASSLTLAIPADSIESAVEILIRSANSRWEPDALDVLPGGHRVAICLRGPEEALHSLAHEILETFGAKEGEGVILSAEEAEELWKGLREFGWSYLGETLVKVALAPTDVAPLAHAVEGLGITRLHFSSGGNVAFLSIPSGLNTDALHAVLQKLGLSGMVLRGAGPLWLGQQSRPTIAAAVKQALDPENRFPSFDD